MNIRPYRVKSLFPHNGRARGPGGAEVTELGPATSTSEVVITGATAEAARGAVVVVATGLAVPIVSEMWW